MNALVCKEGSKSALIVQKRSSKSIDFVALPEQMHFSPSPSFITVELLACLSSPSPFSSSLTALLALTNLMDLDYLNVTSPASFLFFMLTRSVQPEEACPTPDDKCGIAIRCFVSLVVNVVAGHEKVMIGLFLVAAKSGSVYLKSLVSLRSWREARLAVTWRCLLPWAVCFAALSFLSGTVGWTGLYLSMPGMFNCANDRPPDSWPFW